MILGLVGALCLVGMLNNGSLNKLVSILFFGILTLIFTIPMMMVQGLLVLGMGALLVLYTYWLGFAAWGVLWYWLRVRK